MTAWTIKNKLILLNLFVSIVALSMFYFVIHQTYANQLIQQIDRSLESQSQLLKRIIKFDGNSIDLYQQSDMDHFPPLEYRIWEINKKPSRRSVGMMFVELPFPGKEERIYEQDFAGKTYRIMVKLFHKPNTSDEASYIMQVVQPLNIFADSIEQLNNLLIILLPLPLLMIFVGSWWITHRSLRPLNSLIREINQTNAINLNQQIPVVSTDEVGKLTEAYNHLLKRLTDAFESLKSFTSNASHELRTPLTSIRSQGEIILAKERDQTEYINAIGSILEDTHRLENLCATLLQLARNDAGIGKYSFQDENLSQLVNHWLDQLSPLADVKGIKIKREIRDALHYKLDKNLFESLLINLFENAINYSKENSEIIVALGETSTQIRLQIDDSAQPIPPDQYKQIFNRFVRLDATRHMAAGSGLGLAICQWAADAHHAQIAVEANPLGGNRFSVILNKSSVTLHK